ncbi:MAG: 3'-5' exonuclease [Planctomycetales bacterium]|nr:3'-5' exonuclease [Planctomycetales bacterium]
MAASDVKYLVFDCESVADGALVSKLRYSGEQLSPEDAIARYRAELMEKYDSDFIPYTFQLPVSVAIAKLGAQYQLLDLVVLDEPEFRPHVITEHFWRGWNAYRRPTLVSFNGRTFDLPLLELAAFRYGVDVPAWFTTSVKTYDQPRNRYNTAAHLDVYDLLTNFGASRFTGGLNLAASLLGKPGKMEVQGHMVQDMYHAGKLAEINDYCRCDVLDTYFVFLRSRVLTGDLKLADEQQLVDAARAWLEAHADASPAYADYLSQWGDWTNPWSSDPA